jgi:hypothetical protein
MISKTLPIEINIFILYKMSCIITSWLGRLGNNIHQLRNAIIVALYHKCNINLPSHPFFNKTDIILFESEEISDTNFVINDLFFLMTKFQILIKHVFSLTVTKIMMKKC